MTRLHAAKQTDNLLALIDSIIDLHLEVHLLAIPNPPSCAHPLPSASLELPTDAQRRRVPPNAQRRSLRYSDR